MASFSGYPLTRWKGDRLMILEEEFYYIDKDQKKWLVPVGGELNGATIPRVLWSIIGSSYVGAYRRASVVHDFFVGEGNNPDVAYQKRREADKMFFRACRTDGCSWRFAAKLYIGVSIGSWSSKRELKQARFNKELELIEIRDDEVIAAKYFEVKEKSEYILSNEENFELLEAFVEEEIRRQ